MKFVSTIKALHQNRNRAFSSHEPRGEIPHLMEKILDRVTSLRNWWSIYNGNGEVKESSTEKLLLLDLRTLESYEQRRLASFRLLVVPFPVQHLKERSYELPARHVEFSILVEKDFVKDAMILLLGIKHQSRKRPGKPWKVESILLDGPELWEQAAELGIVSDLDKSIDSPTFPLPRLWQPDPMVETIILSHLKNCPSQNGSLQVWDLASGAGRDVAFLAEELLAGGNPYQVWGFDHRYNEKEINTTQSFWERRGVGHLTKCVCMDLSNWKTIVTSLATDQVAALFCVRFWKPDLVSDIAKSSKDLRPGTLFGISHFCKPYDGAPWNFDHPSEKTVLERTQLRDLFQSQGWEILHDDITLDSDHGRTMIQFVAKTK